MLFPSLQKPAAAGGQHRFESFLKKQLALFMARSVQQHGHGPEVHELLDANHIHVRGVTPRVCGRPLLEVIKEVRLWHLAEIRRVPQGEPAKNS